MTNASDGSAASNEQAVQTPPTDSTTVVIQPDAASGLATTIQGNPFDPTSVCRNNGRDTRLLVGADATMVYRSLLQFDLSSIPAGATVTAADLTLTTQAAPAAPLTVAAYASTAAWGEGSGVGSCTGDGASWRDARPGAPWTSQGGDFDPDAWTSYTHDPGGPSVTLGLAGLLRAWREGEIPNNGIILAADGDLTGPTGTAAYESDDSTTASARPRLAVTYTTEAEIDTGHDGYFQVDSTAEKSCPPARLPTRRKTTAVNPSVAATA